MFLINVAANREQRPENRTQPSLEILEDRCVPSADPLQGLTGPLEQLIVGYQDGTSAIVQLDGTVSVEETLAAYQTTPGVAYVERDFQVSIAGTIPNDTYYGELYGLHNTGQTIGSPQGITDTGTVDADIDAPEAWGTFLAAGQTVGSTRIVVGVIDSGIDYTHPDLYLNVWLNQEEIPSAIRSKLTDIPDASGYKDGLITFWDLNNPINQGNGKIKDLNRNGRIDAGDILQPTKRGGWADGVDQDPFTVKGTSYSYKDDLVGWNFVNNTNNPFDDNGHGTHVSGTIGAVGNNNTGMVGVNWVTQMAALKFLNRFGSGNISNAAKAVDYAVGNGMAVTNNSWGYTVPSTALFNAIQNAGNYKQVFVAAAGNESSNNDTNSIYPASYNLANIVTVAATDNDDNLANFSNFGNNTVDLAAPGVNIASTIPGGYAFGSGTSMAAPHVTGSIALLLAKEPTLTAPQVISRLVSTVDTSTDPANGLSTLQGKVISKGRLNLYRALNNLTNPVDGSGTSGDGTSSSGNSGVGGMLSWSTQQIESAPRSSLLPPVAGDSVADDTPNVQLTIGLLQGEPPRTREIETPRRLVVEAVDLDRVAFSDTLFAEEFATDDLVEGWDTPTEVTLPQESPLDDLMAELIESLET